MLIKIIKFKIRIFNNLINSLLQGFTKHDLDEKSIIFLAKRTKHLLSFTQKTLIKLLFQFFKSVTYLNDKIIKDFFDINQMIDNIFKQINESLNNLLIQKFDENRQEDIDDIITNLTFLQKIINALSSLFLSVIKFQSDIIKEEEFKNDYQEFKETININKNKIKSN